MPRSSAAWTTSSTSSWLCAPQYSPPPKAQQPRPTTGRRNPEVPQGRVGTGDICLLLSKNSAGARRKARPAPPREAARDVTPSVPVAGAQADAEGIQASALRAEVRAVHLGADETGARKS